MPWPATHVLVAETAFPLYFNHLDHQAFIIGTCYPDIRYPAQIDRDLTHIHAVPLEDMQTQTSFRAGLLFHTYVDDYWNAYIAQFREQLFSIVPKHRPTFHTLKILQDRYLYEQLEDWTTIIAELGTILPEELTFGASEQAVEDWHTMLQHYLAKPPQKSDLEMLSLTLPPDMVEDIHAFYTSFQGVSFLDQLLVQFYPEIKAHLESVSVSPFQTS
jgi:hypothetical protein